MAGEERAIFTNMCMIYDDDGNILVQDRVNPDWSGVTFPDGHAEAKVFESDDLSEFYYCPDECAPKPYKLM